MKIRLGYFLFWLSVNFSLHSMEADVNEEKQIELQQVLAKHKLTIVNDIVISDKIVAGVYGSYVRGSIGGKNVLFGFPSVLTPTARHEYPENIREKKSAEVLNDINYSLMAKNLNHVVLFIGTYEFEKYKKADGEVINSFSLMFEEMDGTLENLVIKKQYLRDIKSV
jgi:hypothetical protein